MSTEVLEQNLVLVADSICSVYQEYLAKSLADKYTTLSTQMDKLVHEANTEISSLQNKLACKIFIYTSRWMLYLT